MAKKRPSPEPAAVKLKRINDVESKYRDELLKKANVVAVGIGIPILNNRPAGELGIMVSVTHKVDAEKLPAQDLIPTTLDEVRVWVIEVGHPHTGQATEP